MTFDVAKFQATSSQVQAIVKEYDIVEQRAVTLDDLKVSFVDMVIVSVCVFILVMPITSYVTYSFGFGLTSGFYVGVVCVALFALYRYDRTTLSFTREFHQVGVVNWEKTNFQKGQSHKADVRLLRYSEFHGREVDWAGLKLESINYDTLCNVAKVMLETGKFNQRLITQNCNISTDTYTQLCQEFVSQGVLKLNGTAKNSGYSITKMGYNVLSSALGADLSPTSQGGQKFLETGDVGH